MQPADVFEYGQLCLFPRTRWRLPRHALTDIVEAPAAWVLRTGGSENWWPVGFLTEAEDLLAVCNRLGSDGWLIERPDVAAVDSAALRAVASFADRNGQVMASAEFYTNVTIAPARRRLTPQAGAAGEAP